MRSRNYDDENVVRVNESDNILFKRAKIDVHNNFKSREAKRARISIIKNIFNFLALSQIFQVFS